MPSDNDQLYVRLECKTGGSNKFYTVHLTTGASISLTADDTGLLWEVRVGYGRIGQKPISQVKFTGLRTSAVLNYNKLIASKIKKGYKKVSTKVNLLPSSALVDSLEDTSKPAKSQKEALSDEVSDRFFDLDLE